MEMQKLAFFRDAPAPWQGPPQGGPDSLTTVTSIWNRALHNGVGIIQKDITACPHKLVWVSCFFHPRTGLASMRDNPANHNRADDRTGPACIASSLRFCGFCNSLTDLWWYCGSREHGRFLGFVGAYVLQWRSHQHSLLHSSWNYFHLPSNEFFEELWSIQLANGEACLTRETSFLFDLLDSIGGQNAFLTRITSIKEVQHVSFHKSSGCNYGSISLCHRPFPLHFEPDSFLPDRLASIFLIPD